MESKHLLCLFIILHLTVNVFAITTKYFYEFGNKDIGQTLYTTDGKISLFSYNNNFKIPVPPHMDINYVSVTVNAINPPKVDYDNERRILSINFSVLEFTPSSYRIVAKGIPVF